MSSSSTFYTTTINYLASETLRQTHSVCLSHTHMHISSVFTIERKMYSCQIPRYLPAWTLEKSLVNWELVLQFFNASKGISAKYSRSIYWQNNPHQSLVYKTYVSGSTSLPPSCSSLTQDLHLLFYKMGLPNEESLKTWTHTHMRAQAQTHYSPTSRDPMYLETKNVRLLASPLRWSNRKHTPLHRRQSRYMHAQEN